jgi:hypothetical protein
MLPREQGAGLAFEQGVTQQNRQRPVLDGRLFGCPAGDPSGKRHQCRAG